MSGRKGWIKTQLIAERGGHCPKRYFFKHCWLLSKKFLPSEALLPLRCPDACFSYHFFFLFFDPYWPSIRAPLNMYFWTSFGFDECFGGLCFLFWRLSWWCPVRVLMSQPTHGAVSVAHNMLYQPNPGEATVARYPDTRGDPINWAIKRTLPKDATTTLFSRNTLKISFLDKIEVLDLLAFKLSWKYIFVSVINSGSLLAVIRLPMIT